MSGYGTNAMMWSKQQAGFLRRRAAGELVKDTALNWLNIAEAIEDVGISEQAALRSHFATVPDRSVKPRPHRRSNHGMGGRRRFCMREAGSRERCGVAQACGVTWRR
jgi:hypothetical protein